MILVNEKFSFLLEISYYSVVKSTILLFFYPSHNFYYYTFDKQSTLIWCLISLSVETVNLEDYWVANEDWVSGTFLLITSCQLSKYSFKIRLDELLV